MKLTNGNMLFEKGDVLHIVDKLETETLYVKNGHYCKECVFGDICDKRKTNNVIAKYCKETHFVLEKVNEKKG